MIYDYREKNVASLQTFIRATLFQMYHQEGRKQILLATKILIFFFGWHYGRNSTMELLHRGRHMQYSYCPLLFLLK